MSLAVLGETGKEAVVREWRGKIRGSGLYLLSLRDL